MGKSLIICEKPSVAADVARALGVPKKDATTYESDDRIVAFAVGHLVEQVDPERYDARYKTWRYEDLPILPEEFEYEARDARSQKQLTALHKLIRRKDVDELVNACDAGREGELIFKLIVQTARIDKPIRRAWFSSMTRKAIVDAFGHLRPDAELVNLEAAARSRSEADWLVGMNASRAATTRISRRNALSLGRVQTPTLALIVRRDLEIADFVPVDYWQVKGRFATERGDYDGLWHEGARDRIPSPDDAERIRAAIDGTASTVVSVERKPVVEAPPLLYDLTSLQRDANQRFGFTAERTLRAAQACYDQHKVITYPRTNSRFLSTDLIPVLKPTAAHVGRASSDYERSAAYVTGLDVLPIGRVVNDARVTDHHAIIPTDDAHALSALSPDERRIYDLVARRFLAVFHPESRSEATTVETECAGERFRSRGKVLVEAGWRAVYGGVDAAERSADDDEAEGGVLPPLEQGDAGRCSAAEVLAKQTRPPAHYTESSLLRAMETAGRLVDDDEAAEAMKESGLGTPATRAATIERLIDREFVARQGKSLLATDRGVGLIRALDGHTLATPRLTGDWEKRLARIEAGGEDRAVFMRDIRAFTRETVDFFAEKTSEAMRVPRREIGPCPRCDGTILERPRSYSCSSWKSKSEPGCGYQFWKSIGAVTITPEMAADFVTRRLEPEQITAEVEAAREVIGPCPTPDCGGEIIENSRAFGCTSYRSKDEPGCGFVIWKKQRGRPGEVTADLAREMVARGETDAPTPTSREPIGDCPTPDCGGKIVENSRAFGCTSWKSRKEPGCGFVIWKKPRGGGEVTREAAAQMLATGEVTLPESANREPIGECPTPDCGGKIVENSRAFGCTSWKSRKSPGCGFVIWKKPRGLGREISREEAADLLARGLTEPPAASTDAA